MPASQFLLLLRNEIRLYLRSGAISGTSITFLLIGQALLHFIALSIALSASLGARTPMPSGMQVVMLSVGLLSMLLMMTSRSLAGVVQAFYTRGDLDLLLSSPVNRSAIIAVRMSSIGLTVAMEVALLVWPFANVFVLFGDLGWLKAYLLVPAMAMLATSVGLALTLLSFRTIGPRRTRLAVQILAAVIGMGMMLAIYLPRMLSSSSGQGAGRWQGNVDFVMRSGGIRELFMTPTAWVAEGYLPTLAFLAGAAVLLLFTIRMSGERIVSALTDVSAVAVCKVRSDGNAALRMTKGLRRVMVGKELKLIARDPFLIAQLLQQSLFVLPMTFALWQSRGAAGLPLAWVSVVVLASGLAAPLSWITLTAEDAPDLLASAPVSRAALVRAKIEAALLPVLPVCLVPLVFLSRSHPWFGFCVTFCALGAALSAALINTGNPVQRRRDSFKTRHKGSGARGFLEVLSMIVWLLVCVGLAWAGRKLAGWS